MSPVNTSNEKLAIWACAVSSRRRYARSYAKYALARLLLATIAPFGWPVEPLV